MERIIEEVIELVIVDPLLGFFPFFFFEDLEEAVVDDDEDVEEGPFNEEGALALLLLLPLAAFAS